ncbi:hypothetical protein [Methylorubrum suomiense]
MFGAPAAVRRGADVTLAAVIMITGAIGAIALTIAARPSADRFIKW